MFWFNSSLLRVALIYHSHIGDFTVLLLLFVYLLDQCEICVCPGYQEEQTVEKQDNAYQFPHHRLFNQLVELNFAIDATHFWSHLTDKKNRQENRAFNGTSYREENNKRQTHWDWGGFSSNTYMLQEKRKCKNDDKEFCKLL